MPGTNQFLPFAVGAGANTLTPTAYAALTSLLSSGFVAGVAPSAQFNTALRQATTAAAGIAQFIANQNGNAFDNGDPGSFAASFSSALAGVAIPSGALIDFGFSGSISGFIAADGSVPLISSVPALAAAIYCGDANNNTASWGYKCTNPAAPTTTRSTTGTYIVLLDARGRFRRTLSNGASIDLGRSLWAYQDHALQDHAHSISVSNGNGGTSQLQASPTQAPGTASTTGINAGANSAAETRPSNYAATTYFKL